MVVGTEKRRVFSRRWVWPKAPEWPLEKVGMLRETQLRGDSGQMVRVVGADNFQGYALGTSPQVSPAPSNLQGLFYWELGGILIC